MGTKKKQEIEETSKKVEKEEVNNVEEEIKSEAQIKDEVKEIVERLRKP